jgi:hypothetical protein
VENETIKAFFKRFYHTRSLIGLTMKLRSYFATVLVTGILAACTKDYSAQLPGSSPDTAMGSNYGSAIYTLGGSPYACTTDSIFGTYVYGRALDSSVLVSGIGTYVINTANIYGISFHASGIFKTLGVQNVSLYGSGTPIAAGTFNYIPGLNGCSFALTISGASTTIDCKACVYMPTCEGSQYTYIDSIPNSGSNVRIADYLSVADTMIDGIDYRRIITPNGYGYYNCSGGMTTFLVYNMVPTFSGGHILVPFKHIVLEANSAIGASWSSNVANSYGQNFAYVYYIAEKGISRTVLDSTYSDVIHVGTIIHLTSGGVTTSIGTEDFYYARNIGLIERDSSDYTGTIKSQTFLQSYSVPQ